MGVAAQDKTPGYDREQKRLGDSFHKQYAVSEQERRASHIEISANLAQSLGAESKRCNGDRSCSLNGRIDGLIANRPNHDEVLGGYPRRQVWRVGRNDDLDATF